MSKNLNIEKAYIWRIVHRANIPWILGNGLHCPSSTHQDPEFISIGNSDLISKRSSRVVQAGAGGTLSDYVAFYFTPYSPMMYNIFTGRGGVQRRDNEDICILVSSMHKLSELNLPFVFTDRHAYSSLAKYFENLSDLDQIDWLRIQARNFKRDPDDPERFEKYQAEALVKNYLPVSALMGIICYSETAKHRIDSLVKLSELSISVRAYPECYFQ